MSLLHRFDSIAKVATDADLQPSAGYTVTAYRPGGILASDAVPGPAVGVYNITTNCTLHSGHGLEVLNRVMVGIDTNVYTLVAAVNGNVVTVLGSVDAVTGDTLMNLGADTGSITPSYDGSDISIYNAPSTDNPLSQAAVTTNEDGEYDYYHAGDQTLWELVRGADGLPVAFVVGAYQQNDGRVQNTIRYAHLFATSGTGTEADPWTVAGSNPIQAAINDLPSSGGEVFRVPGWYSLGAADPAVTIPVLTSATDRRAYVMSGAGRDLVFETYSGTGSAYRYPQVNTGSVGSSWQSNRNVFRGFSILQTGTARTGNGIYLSYASHNLFEDMSVGCSRALQSAGEADTGFAYGLRFEGPASDEVADFNTFQGCFFLGNTLGVYMQNQCDNAKFYDCHFEPRQDAAVAQNGVWLGNGQGWTFSGCHFNYFNYDANSYAIRLNTVVQGVDIHGCYFEGNSNGVYLYTDGNQKGVHIHGNFFTGNSTTTHVGVRAGIDGATYTVQGLVVEANSFAGLSTSEIGVRIGSDVKDFKLIGNTYDIGGGGTEVVLQTGCRGIRFEPTASSSAYPRLQLVDSAQDQGHIILLTNKAAAESSPRLYFAPGNSGSVFSLSADSSGILIGKDTSGATVFQVTQAGGIVATSNIASGGSLTGLSTPYALSGNSNIPTSGRLVTEITNVSGTNTFTLAAPSSQSGQLLILRCVALTAGTMTLADSGNVDLSAAWTPDAGDTLTLAAGSSQWFELGRSSN